MKKDATALRELDARSLASVVGGATRDEYLVALINSALHGGEADPARIALIVATITEAFNRANQD